MKEYKVPVQSLIDHIKSAMDVDPWAAEMAEDLLKRNVPVEIVWKCGFPHCSACGQMIPEGSAVKYCLQCGQAVKWE